MTNLSRRSLITGLISLAAAPAIVRAASLMPIKVIEEEAAWDFSPFYSIYPLNASPQVKSLLASRIIHVEKVLVENIKMELFGERLFGISGRSNVVYSEACPPDTVYVFPR